MRLNRRTRVSARTPIADAPPCRVAVDQSDIAANLQALPIFLSGCKELLVLAGATYPTRLW